MLTIDQDASKAFLPLANTLFAELQAFGRLAISHDMDSEASSRKENIKAYVEARRVPFGIFFLTLEQEAGLRLSEARLPFRFNQATWPEDMPLAGYTSAETLLPSQFAEALFSNWLQDASGSEDGRFLRVFRSALWVALHQGIAASIEYAFDLLETGGAVDCHAVARTVVFLLAARSQTSSEQEMVERLVDGGAPDSRAKWLVFYPTLDWLEPEQLSDAMREIVGSLIERGIQRVEQVRGIATFDAWITAYASLSGLLHTLFLVVRWTQRELPLSFKTILSLFEEIVADSHAIRACLEMGTFALGLHYGQGIADEYRATVGKNWERRLLRERLLAPQPLHTLLLADADPVLPSDWILPSPHIAYPWTLLDTDEHDPVNVYAKFVDGKVPTLDELKDLPDLKQRRDLLMQGLDESQELLSQGDSETALARLQELLRYHPWSYPIFFMISRAFYDMENVDTALEYVMQAILLEIASSAHWKLLSSVLIELDRLEEAKIALLFRERFSAFRS